LGNGFPKQGNDISIMGNDFPKQGNDISILGNDFPKQGNDISIMGNDFPKQGNDFLKAKNRQNSRKNQVFSQKPGQVASARAGREAGQQL